jgi:single-strand DNA-binding protein
MNINKAIIVGRITNDLEVKSTTSGREVLSFSVATNRSWKDQAGNKQEKTEFHNVVAWGKTAQTIAQYFIKGQEIYVEGHLETRSWEDEASKKKMYRTEILLDQFEFGQKPGGAAASSGNYSASAAKGAKNNSSESEIQYPIEDINPEDIPF